MTQDADVLAKVTAFCKRHGISTAGVLMFTAQQNRTTDIFSLIIDFDSQQLLDV
jgi:hypothetical protein